MMSGGNIHALIHRTSDVIAGEESDPEGVVFDLAVIKHTSHLALFAVQCSRLTESDSSAQEVELSKRTYERVERLSEQPRCATDVAITC